MAPSPATEPRRSMRRPRTKPANADAEIERGGKRRRSAAGKAGTRGNDKQKQPAAAPLMMVDAGGAIDDDDDVCASEPDEEQLRLEEEEEEAAALEAEEQANAQTLGARKRRAAARPSATQEQADASEDHFVGDPMPDDEARRRWPERYTTKDSDDPQVTQRSDGEEEKIALCHYTSARVDNADFDLGDDVYVRAAPGEKDYIGRITEFFQGVDHGSYFSCRWFFRVADTVITAKLLKVGDHEHDQKRVFLSEEKDDNLIESIISKVNITYVGPNVAPQDKSQLIAKSDLYYDMSYSEAYSTFSNMPPENIGAAGSETTSDISCDDVFSSKEKLIADFAAPPDAQMGTATLLDLYSGCGAMSTGLSMGAALFGLKFNRKWAVDMNPYACNSLKHNHPRTEVRNEKAENYLSLLQEWEALCKAYDVYNRNFLPRTMNDDEVDENVPLSEGTFEVEKFVDICYGDPNSTGKDGLCFKQCLVACDETEAKNVEKALVLSDALSDLPKVGNDQPNDVMPYNSRPITEFQRYIRLNRKVLCQGANFRNLKGVRVGKNKKVEFDPDIPRVYLSSGKPLVPNYAMTFMKGKSVKPFGRLWLDETVSTVVTRAEPHNQAILHPKQDRVLTVRENARLQGFPDYYKLYGPIKQKYIQVGNAVAIPVARALGYSLAQAYQQREFDGDQRPLFKLPGNFIPVAARLPQGNSGGEEAVEEE
ncbi:hypothetical protein ACQ4PT_020633 [Festuca glaucescens]